MPSGIATPSMSAFGSTPVAIENFSHSDVPDGLAFL